MPVFLRWLLVDLIVRRILRHRRVRPYVDRAYPVVSDYTTRFGRRAYPVVSEYTTRFGRRVSPKVAGGIRYARQRSRFSGCSGCLALTILTILALIISVVLVHSVW